MVMQLDPLMPRIERALAKQTISATKFGYVVAGDPALVKKMRDGRRVRVKLRRKLEVALARIERGGAL